MIVLKAHFWRSVERMPLLLPALALMAGMLLAPQVRSVSSWQILLLLAGVLGAAWTLFPLNSDYAGYAFCLLGFACIGWLWNQQLVEQRRQELGLVLPLTEVGTVPEWIGYLYRDPEVSADKTILYLQLTSATHRDDSYRLETKSRLTVFASGDRRVSFAFGDPKYGDLLRVRASLTEPRNFRNPGMFDYVAHLKRQGILLVGSLKSPLLVEKLAGHAGNPLLAAAYAIRRSFRDYLIQQFSTMDFGGDASAILVAVLFGERSRLSSRIEKLFQETGTYHVFVVSGFNTTIIALSLVWLMRKIGIPALAVVFLVGVVLTMYALMTELGSPVVRASILSFVVLLADALYRKSNLVNSLALAAMATLLVWPDLIWDPGFQLTYVCCLAIVLIGLPAVRHTLIPFRIGLSHLFDENSFLISRGLFPRFARRLRFEVEMFIERLGDWGPWRRRRYQRLGAMAGRIGVSMIAYLGSLLIISVAIQIALVPLMAYYFNRANVAAYLANLLVVPLMTVLLLTTLFLGGFLWVWGWSWAPWVWLSSWLLEHLLKWLENFSQEGFWHWRVQTPPLGWVVLYFILILGFVVLNRPRRRTACFVLTLMMLTTFWWSPFPLHRETPGQLEVYFLDVGQGDSIFLVSPRGQTILVDGGGLIGGNRPGAFPAGEAVESSRFDIGEDVISRFLWTLRVRRLNYVVLTHPHQDHAGGLEAVIKNFPVGALLGPSPAERLVADLPRLSELAAERKLSWQELNRDAGWMLGPSVVEVLNPPRAHLGPFDTINNRSVVLRVSWGRHALLLTGDIEKSAEWDMALECSKLKSDILKVPHHGSATSSSETFLDCVRPEWCVISAGWNSRFSHPSREVVDRLHKRDVGILETSKVGAVFASISERTVKVRPAVPIED